MQVEWERSARNLGRCLVWVGEGRERKLKKNVILQFGWETQLFLSFLSRGQWNWEITESQPQPTWSLQDHATNCWRTIKLDSFFFFLDIEFLFFLLSFFSLYFLSLHFYAMKHSIEKPHFIFTLKERYIHRNTPENTFLLHSLVTNFLFFHRKQNTEDALIALEILSPTQVERKSADISFNSQSNVWPTKMLAHMKVGNLQFFTSMGQQKYAVWKRHIGC